MGGNATKQWNTERFTKEEYNAVCQYIAQIMDLTPLFKKDEMDDYVANQTLTELNGSYISEANKLYAFIPCYFEKDSFGDLDFLTTNNHISVIEKLQKADDVEVIGKVKSGNCTSYAIRFKSISHKAFQLDIIHVDTSVFHFALHYFSFNDLGNFIGRIASAARIKFGFDGMFRKVYFNNHGDIIPVYSLKEQQPNDNSHSTVVKKTEVLLTCNFFTALDFLGFDVERYKQGFATLDEIFEFIYQSKFFKESYFSLDNRPADMRARDKKRTNYGLALDYFAKKGEKTSLCLLPDDEIINQTFPHSLEEMLGLQKEMQHKIKIKESINSKKIVQSLLNEIGQAVKAATQAGIGGNAGIELVSLDKNEQYVSLTKRILLDDYDELVKKDSLTKAEQLRLRFCKSKHDIVVQKFVPHDFLGKMIQQLNKNELVQQGYFVDNQHQEEFDKLIFDVFESELANYKSFCKQKSET